MGKMILGAGLFIVGVMLTVTVVGAIPGMIMVVTGFGMMFVGFASFTKSTVKGGMTAGKVIREMRREQDVTPAPASMGSGMSSVADEIRKLSDLVKDGLLSQEEFEAKKQSLLSR